MQPPLDTPRYRAAGTVVILLLVAGGFLPGIDNYFAGDDFDWLFNTVRTVSHPEVFLGVQSNFVRHGESLFFIVNYLVAGFSFPVFFLSSLMIHLINVVLVNRLLVRLGCDELPALAGALLWGLDYRHCEAVFRLYGVADPLALVFCLCSLLLFINRRPWLATLALLGGLFSKENALVFPALAVLWTLLFEPRGGRWRRLAETLPQWLAVAAFVPLMTWLSSAQSSYLELDTGVFSRFWEIVLSMIGPDAVYLKQVVIGTEAPLVPLWLALPLCGGLAASWWRMPPRYRFAVAWIVITTAPTVFVAFQVSRYYYAPLVGVVMLVALVGTDLLGRARRRGRRRAVAAAAALYVLYLAHAVWGLRVEESDYQFIGDLHRRAALSFEREVVDRLPGPGGPLTIFVRGDTMIWADALTKRYNGRPWFWPTTYKWVYRRPFGVLGLSNTYGFVTHCLDRRRGSALFAAAPRDDYDVAMSQGDVLVVVHEAPENRFRIAIENERREVADAARASDLYRYLQPGRIDPTAAGVRQLGH